MGAENPEEKAVRELSELGFPMLDRRQVMSSPTMDSAILKTLPEKERNEIMSQMGSDGVVIRMRGNRVSSVEKKQAMPELDFSHYLRISFKEFLDRSTATTRGKWEGFPPAGQ
jgi:hypothetical protein